ncbi:MAG: ATP-binding protein [Candidatus Methylomirabilia bacterium]
MGGSGRGSSAVLILLFFGGLTAWLLWQDAGPASRLRYGYLALALWAALCFGHRGGVLASLLALLLYAPFVLPAIEREGLTGETLEGVITMGWLVGVGPLVGALVSQARLRSKRYQTLLALRRTWAGTASLDERLKEGVEQMRRLFGAHRVTLVVALDGAAPRAARAWGESSPEVAEVELEPRAVAAWIWSRRTSLFISDLLGDPRLGGDGLAAGRVSRALILPLQGREGPLGVLIVERIGEIPRAERRALEALGLHLALGVENAALALRQRRFTAELEERVEAATRRLRQLDRIKSDFLSTVSHELRTPLTSLRGFSELLLTRALAPERQRQFLGYILCEVERLGRIVEDLLDLSRIESAGGRSLNLTPLELGPLLLANAELFGVQSPNHEVRVEGSLDLPRVLADGDAVDRVVKNLLSNAIKYSPRGGAVYLRATRSIDDPGMVELEVEDHGVGISPEGLPRIFDKYHRLPHRDTAGTRGLGIGLALVKSLVEAHGGAVRVESRPGRGSRFTVTLPEA